MFTSLASLTIVPIYLVSSSTSYNSLSLENNDLNIVEIENFEDYRKNEYFSEEVQKKIIKDVTFEDVFSQLKTTSSNITKIYKSSFKETNNYNKNSSYKDFNVYDDISKNLDLFKDVTNKIISGELELNNILKNFNDYKKITQMNIILLFLV